MKHSEYFNVPNVLTFLRLLLVPVVIVLIAQNHMIWALAAFLTACGTDLLDGYIARRCNIITKLGIWLDPLADKLMAVSVLVTFTVRGIFPAFVMIIVLAKEFLLLLAGLIVLKKGYSTPSDKLGKIAALVLNITIGAGFLYEFFYPYYLYAAYIALALVIAAFIHYAVKNGHLVFAKAPADDIKPAEKEQ